MAGPYYVDSNKTGGSQTGADWTNAFLTIKAGVDACSAGEEVWVHTATTPHSETISAADENWDGPTSDVSGPIRIIGIDGNDDSYNIATSANLTLTSTYDLNIDGDFEIYGIRFAVNGTGYINVDNNNTESVYMEDCYIDASSGTPTYYLYMATTGPQLFRNCTFANGADNSYMYLQGVWDTTFIGCTWTSSATPYICSVGSGGSTLYFIGCDFSGYTNLSGRIFANYSGGTAYLYGCKWTTSCTFAGLGGLGFTYHTYETDTDSGNNPQRNEKFQISEGEVKSDTGTYRSGGATYDGTNEYSYVINNQDSDATSNPTFTDWNTGYINTSGSKTWTVYIANATADYNDRQIWLEVEYFGSASSTMKTVATDRVGPRATAAAQTDDTGSTWVSAKTYMQKLEVTATVNRAGSYRWRVGSTVATDIYICPKIEIT